jgi:hypothetical protein
MTLLKKILKKHLIVLLKMMSPLKILLQFLKKKNDDEESSHASIGNQETFEGQVYEENLDDKSIQASIPSPCMKARV